MGSPTRPSPPRPARKGLEPERLEALLDEAMHALGDALGAGNSRSGDGGLPRLYRARLGILRAVVGVPGAALVPRLDSTAPLGHSLPEVDRLLGVGPGEGLEALEELAELGLLERHLHNLVHACAGCQQAHLNFRETCPECSGIELSIERLVHHFRCAYQGLESEFVEGASLVCPKCRRTLNQLGQDFERPHDTYQCHDCEFLFEEPTLEAQCLCCTKVFPAGQALSTRIHAFVPTALAARAVELNRLTDLDLAQMLFDRELRLDTREFLVLEAKREVYRLQRHGTPLSAGVLLFELEGSPYPIWREWDAESTSRLGELLQGSRFPLDMIARIGSKYLGVLLPHTDAAGREVVGRRYRKILEELHLTSASGHPLRAMWFGRTWTSPTTTADDVLDFLNSGGSGE